jgi:hypothetical protein
MSLLSLIPDSVVSASGNLESLGSALRAANTAAASQTTAIAAPAADEVSVAITELFGTHAQEFQILSAKAAAFHEGFVNLLNGGAAQYVSTEVANAAQTLVNAFTGSGLVAAATNSAAAAVSTTNSYYHLGPLGLSLHQSTTPLAGGGSRQTANAVVALNTPVGRLVLGSVGGSATQTTNAFSASGYVGNAVGAVELWAGGTSVPPPGGGFSGTLHAGASLNTAFGRVGLLGPLNLSATGTPLSFTNNEFSGALNLNGTLNTPVGPVSLLYAGATANIPANGPVLLAAHGSVTGLGPFDLSLRGISSTGAGGVVLQFTGATLFAPAAVALLVGQAGPVVIGGTAIVNNTTEVLAALGRGNLAGAASLYFSSPFTFANAVLFGQETITIPLGSGTSVGAVDIPIGGVFAPLRPISVTVPPYSYNDPSTNTTLTLLGSEFSVEGTQFGGIVPTFLTSLVHSL